MKRIRVVVLMGGRGAEHEVSLASGKKVAESLDKNKYEVLPVILDKEKTRYGLSDLNWIDQYKPDVVFIVIHGRLGEDGVIQGVLEFLGIPYVGSGVLASAIGMNKVMFKRVMEAEKIRVPKWVVVDSKESDFLTKILKLGKKWVVKPVDQGSSVGVSLAENSTDLEAALSLAFKYGNKVIVEEFINGTEVSCGIIGNKEIKVLPIIEICPKNQFFNYEAKYKAGMSLEIVPARILKGLERQINETSVKIYSLLGCRGFARVDYIIKDQLPYVLEINTIPGMTGTSLLPKEAESVGISYSKLVGFLVKEAVAD